MVRQTGGLSLTTSMANIDSAAQILVDLETSERDFEHFLLYELRKGMESAINLAIPNIRHQIGVLVSSAIISTPEFESLVGGKLREELGIPDALPILYAIIQKVVDSIEVKMDVSAGELPGVVVKILRADFQDVLQVHGTSYVSVGKRGSAVVKWLEWLLFAGSEVVLTEVAINTKRQSRAASRTGRAIMVHPTIAPKGWSVPSEFAGTIHDNFLTRATESLEPEIQKIVFEQIEQRMY